MTFVSELSPQALWRRFDQVLSIYRPSRGEEAMRSHVLGIAAENGLEHASDEAGNVVVRKPGSPGHEGASVTVLQSHLDMVYERNSDVDHDFATEPIVAERDGEYLTARGTTLGSDNGIGVAAMLALMESGELVHGPLELLFTVDEETGLTGAGNLSPHLLHGKRLLNLDTEEEGAVYVGCAGGVGSKLTLPLNEEEVPAGAVALTAKATGFKGGHSGVDIHLQRGNAIKLLARALGAAFATAKEPRLSSLRGGSAHNAIPREAFATVVLGTPSVQPFTVAFEAEAAAILEEYRPAERDPSLALSPTALPAGAWSLESSARALRLVNALPHGVMTMSYAIPELVETSTTLATLGEADGALEILLSSRSSVDSAIAFQARRLRALGELAGATVEEEGTYPGWKPRLESELLAVLERVHLRELGSEPEVKAIHAGLECGILGEKYPGLDMISFGPQIEFPHSPDERVLVASVDRFWQLLRSTLAELALS